MHYYKYINLRDHEIIFGRIGNVILHANIASTLVQAGISIKISPNVEMTKWSIAGFTRVSVCNFAAQARRGFQQWEKSIFSMILGAYKVVDFFCYKLFAEFLPIVNRPLNGVWRLLKCIIKKKSG